VTTVEQINYGAFLLFLRNSAVLITLYKLHFIYSMHCIVPDDLSVDRSLSRRRWHELRSHSDNVRLLLKRS